MQFMELNLCNRKVFMCKNDVLMLDDIRPQKLFFFAPFKPLIGTLQFKEIGDVSATTEPSHSVIHFPQSGHLSPVCSLHFPQVMCPLTQTGILASLELVHTEHCKCSAIFALEGLHLLLYSLLAVQFSLSWANSPSLSDLSRAFSALRGLSWYSALLLILWFIS